MDNNEIIIIMMIKKEKVSKTIWLNNGISAVSFRSVFNYKFWQVISKYHFFRNRVMKQEWFGWISFWTVLLFINDLKKNNARNSNSKTFPLYLKQVHWTFRKEKSLQFENYQRKLLHRICFKVHFTELFTFIVLQRV